MVQTNNLLEEAIDLHGRLLNEPPPNNPVSACLTRCRIATKEFKKDIEQNQFQATGLSTMVAQTDALTALSYIKRASFINAPLSDGTLKLLAKQGITDPEEARKAQTIISEVHALEHLVSIGMQQAFFRTEMGYDPQRIPSENALIAARRLYELSPTAENIKGLVIVLNRIASALINLADNLSLAEAKRYLDEAEELLDKIDNVDKLLAQILLNQAFLLYNMRIQPGSIELLDRTIELAEKAEDMHIQRAALSLRSQFLGLAGRLEEAMQDARGALGSADDRAPSIHHLNYATALINANKPVLARREVEAGLAAAIEDVPLGSEVLNLLYVSTETRISRDLSLAALRCAETVIEARRLRIGNRSDLIGFDDAVKRRLTIGSLIIKQLEAKDYLGALATADQHRARTFIDPQKAKNTNQYKPYPRLPGKDAGLNDMVTYLQNYADTFISNHGGTDPLNGRELVDVIAKHNRCTVIFHPSDNKLHIFVVRPSNSIIVAAAVASKPFDEILEMTKKLRDLLGISVSNRTERGQLPPQLLEDLLEELADDDTEEFDEELDHLCTELHDALFSDLEKNNK